MAEVHLTIENRTIPLIEALQAKGPGAGAKMLADWQPFQVAGIDMCQVVREGGRLIAQPSPEFVRFCAERGVHV